jgi:hypothetical protein
MSGRAALKHAIDAKAKHHAIKQQNVRAAEVLGVSPITVKMFGYAHELTEDNDFDLSQWVRFYHAIVRIRPGDMALMQHEGALVMFDIVSNIDVVRELNRWDDQRGPS